MNLVSAPFMTTRMANQMPTGNVWFLVGCIGANGTCRFGAAWLQKMPGWLAPHCAQPQCINRLVNIDIFGGGDLKWTSMFQWWDRWGGLESSCCRALTITCWFCSDAQTLNIAGLNPILVCQVCAVPLDSFWFLLHIYIYDLYYTCIFLHVHKKCIHRYIYI